MATATGGAGVAKKAGIAVINIAAIELWLAKVVQAISLAYGDFLSAIVRVLKTSGVAEKAAPLVEGVGEIFRITELATSFVLYKLFDLAFFAMGLDPDKRIYDYIIVAVTMVFLTYQFSVRRYRKLVAQKQAKAKADQKLKEGAGKGVAIGLGALAGGLLSLGNPFLIALGGLVGAMLADTAEAPKPEADKGVDGRLALVATGLGITASLIYTLILLAIIHVSNLAEEKSKSHALLAPSGPVQVLVMTG